MYSLFLRKRLMQLHLQPLQQIMMCRQQQKAAQLLLREKQPMPHRTAVQRHSRQMVLCSSNINVAWMVIA